MNRTPVLLHRESIVSDLSRSIRCTLCFNRFDCMGVEYSTPSRIVNDQVVIPVPKGFSDWESLERTIWSLKDRDTTLRLILSEPVPDSIIWAASYSQRNLLQLNINMTKDCSKFACNMCSIAGKCGLYTLLFFYPIIPAVIRSANLIKIMSKVSSLCKQHYAVKFTEFNNVTVLDEDWVRIHNDVTALDYVRQVSGERWFSTNKYQNRFINILQSFCEPFGITISVCGRDECTGLGW